MIRHPRKAAEPLKCMRAGFQSHRPTSSPSISPHPIRANLYFSCDPLPRRHRLHSFLARPPLPSPRSQTLAALARQPILITGAAAPSRRPRASPGRSQPASPDLLESSESNLYASPPNSPIRLYHTILGSTADPALLEHIFATHSRPSSSTPQHSSTSADGAASARRYRQQRLRDRTLTRAAAAHQPASSFSLPTRPSSRPPSWRHQTRRRADRAHIRWNRSSPRQRPRLAR